MLTAIISGGADVYIADRLDELPQIPVGIGALSCSDFSISILLDILIKVKKHIKVIPNSVIALQLGKEAHMKDYITKVHHSPKPSVWKAKLQNYT